MNEQHSNAAFSTSQQDQASSHQENATIQLLKL